MAFKITYACVKCGACAQQCPVGAIPLDDPSQTLGDLCINCMRCVEVCPQQCRALPDAFLNMVTQMSSSLTRLVQVSILT